MSPLPAFPSDAAIEFTGAPIFADHIRPFSVKEEAIIRANEYAGW